MSGSEQLALPGADPGPVTFVSPSALDTYDHCPRLYRFLYVDRRWQYRRADPRQSLGTSVHSALRELFRLPVSRRSLEVLIALLDRGWVREGYPDRATEQQELERAREALRGWFARTDTTVVPRATEVALQAQFGDVVLKGRLDRVDGAPDGLVVVDYKTSRQAASQSAADGDRALGIYAALVERRLGQPVARLVLDYVVAGATVVTRRPARVLGAQLDGVLGTARRLRADRVFEPNVGPWCAACDLRPVCPEGQAVVAEPSKPPAEGFRSRTYGARPGVRG